MGINVYQVDAFTDKPFSGNPAAVCILSEPRNESWMQNVAKEMNLSETAFILKQKDGFNLRWFTPKVEVSLCGHATLASAHVLYQSEYLKPQEVARFHTLSGLLEARTRGERLELSFPRLIEEPAEPPHGLLEALNIAPIYIGKSEHAYLLELDSEDAVRVLKPDFALLARNVDRGVIVTAISSSEDYDFVSRFFAPSVGINEDPVTGAAHCCLGPFWSKRLNRNEFVAYQASQRGGIVRIRIEKERVFLSGQAVIVLRGELIC